MKDLDDFINFKKENGVKELTLRHYRQVIGWILKTAKERGMNDDPRTMTDQEFRRIIQEMDILSNSTKTTVAIFKMYLKFVGNPLDVRFLLNQESPNARWITEDDFIRIFNECTDPTIKIILHLGGNYGLRRIEMSRLMMDDVGNGVIRVTGKGHGKGKHRIVPLLQDDVVISEYLEWRTKMLKSVKCDRTEGRFVVGYCPSNDMLSKYEPQSITQKIGEYFREHGIDASTHSLRREFVTTAYRAGADLITIQRLVGHTSPQTTERYIQNDIDAATDAIMKRNFYISNRTMT